MHACKFKVYTMNTARLRKGGPYHEGGGKGVVEYKRHNFFTLLTNLSADLESMYRIKMKIYR
jgi:hypothetical protein